MPDAWYARSRRRLRRFAQAVAWAALALLITGFGVSLLGGYLLGWDWTGFSATTTNPPAPLAPEYRPARTLWDWLELLIVPVVLAIVAFMFNRAERRNEQAIAHDRFSENALQTYLTQMSALLLDSDMALQEGSPEARTVARMRTLTVLRQLDPLRKAIVLNFLWDARLIRQRMQRLDPLIDLRGANLSNANLRGTDLRGSMLREVNLRGADLRDANLSRADLSSANLRGANLYGADLSDAILKLTDMSDADLRRITLTNDTVLWRCTLRGARMDDAIAGHLNDAIMT
jgi:hypothetical protein